MEATLEHDADARRIRHLLELGYSDPDETSKDAAAERESKGEAVAAVQRAVGAGRIEEAHQGVSALVERWPADLSICALAAKVCHTAGKHRNALDHLDELMYAGVETPSVVLLRGVVLLSCRKVTEAIDQLEYAKRLDPHQKGANGCLGEAYLRVGRTHDAELAFRKELARFPISPRSHQGLAVVFCRRGDFVKAVDHSLSSVESAPRHWSTHWWLGVSLAGAERVAESAIAFENAARLNADKAAPYRWLARIHHADPERAQEYKQIGNERIKRRLMTRRSRHGRANGTEVGTRPSAP